MLARLDSGSISSVSDFVAEVQLLLTGATRNVGAVPEFSGTQGSETASALQEMEEELKELQTKW